MNLECHPIVSVVIAVYNGAKYIRCAIESILNQTFTDYEIIVVDDGSTDDTNEAVAEYVRSGRVRYFYQDNKGLAGARNTGVHNAQGLFLKFLDCDDQLYPRQLELQVKDMEDRNLDITATGYDLFYESNHKKVAIKVVHKFGTPLANFIRGNAGPVHSHLVRKSCVIKAGGFADQLKMAEDFDLWLRVLRMGARWGIVDYIGCSYLIRAGSMASDEIRFLKGKWLVYERFNKSIRDDLATLDDDLIDELLRTDMRNMHKCLFKKLALREHFVESLALMQLIWSKRKRGIPRLFYVLIGPENLVKIDYRKQCLLNPKYKMELWEEEFAWRSCE